MKIKELEGRYNVVYEQIGGPGKGHDYMLTREEIIEGLRLTGEEETHDPVNYDDEDPYFRNVIYSGNGKFSFFYVSVPVCECETCKSVPLYGVSRKQWNL